MNSRLLVVKFWGSQKLCCYVQIFDSAGSASLTSELFKGQFVRGILYFQRILYQRKAQK